MANFIKSKVQQCLSFLLVLVIAFSAFSGVLFVNPSPAYAYIQKDLDRARSGDKNLVGADLSGASFNLADLTGANLTGASFNLADLREANLTGAILTGADLNSANLTGAILKSDRYNCES